MENELTKFINDVYSGKTKNKKDGRLPDEPRNYNFNWHYKGNFEDESSALRQAQIEDIADAFERDNNNFESFNVMQMKEDRGKSIGNRSKQVQRGYTDNVEVVKVANQTFNERLNILQPDDSKAPLESQLTLTGKPLPQKETPNDPETVPSGKKLEKSLTKLLKNKEKYEKSGNINQMIKSLKNQALTETLKPIIKARLETYIQTFVPESQAGNLALQSITQLMNSL